MPRRAAATIRPVEPDPVHRSRLVSQVVNKVMLDGIGAAALADDGQRVVDDLLGRRLLAVEHHLVDDLLDEARAVDGVRRDGTDLCGGAARHYFFLTPYCERAFLRSLTPAASSVPRTTL